MAAKKTKPEVQPTKGLKILVGDSYLTRSALRRWMAEFGESSMTYIWSIDEYPSEIRVRSRLFKNTTYIFVNPDKATLERLAIDLPYIDRTKNLACILIDTPSVDGRMTFYKQYKANIQDCGYITEDQKNTTISGMLSKTCPTLTSDGKKELLASLPIKVVELPQKTGGKKQTKVIDTYRLVTEVCKLKATGKPVDSNVIKDHIIPQSVGNTWDLVDRIFMKDTKQCLPLIDVCLNSVGDCMMFAGLLLSQAILCLMVKALLEEDPRMDQWEIIKRLSDNALQGKYEVEVLTTGEPKSLISAHPFRVTRCMEWSKKWSLEGLKNVIHTCKRLSINLRSKCSWRLAVIDAVVNACES